jgi:hypothetical protein
VLDDFSGNHRVVLPGQSEAVSALNVDIVKPHRTHERDVGFGNVDAGYLKPLPKFPVQPSGFTRFDVMPRTTYVEDRWSVHQIENVI